MALGLPVWTFRFLYAPWLSYKISKVSSLPVRIWGLRDRASRRLWYTTYSFLSLAVSARYSKAPQRTIVVRPSRSRRRDTLHTSITDTEGPVLVGALPQGAHLGPAPCRCILHKHQVAYHTRPLRISVEYAVLSHLPLLHTCTLRRPQRETRPGGAAIHRPCQSNPRRLCCAPHRVVRPRALRTRPSASRLAM